MKTHHKPPINSNKRHQPGFWFLNLENNKTGGGARNNPSVEDVRFDLWLKPSFGFKKSELLKAFEFYHLWETVP